VENKYTSEELGLFAIFVPKILMIGRNLTKFWQKISLHSFLRHGVYWHYLVRTVRDAVPVETWNYTTSCS